MASAKKRRKPHMVPVGGSLASVAPSAVPTSADSKAVIVAWLLAHGVSFTEAALMNLSKDELLELVANLLDNP